MALTNTKFQTGMTTQQYIDQIKVNKDPFVEIYNSVRPPEDAKSWFDGLSEPVNMAVFTADWCGDAMTTTPAVLRLADECENISVQVFNRDDDVPLADTFLPEHRAGTVPIFVVFDQSMNEIARFIETAGALVPQIDAMDEAVAKESEGQTEGEARTAARGKRTAHRVSHAKDWGDVILREFKDVVAEGFSMAPADRPSVGGTKWPPED